MIYFISDQHLGLGNRLDDRQRETILLQLLSSIKPHCERLFILGDLFDYWFEYSTVVQKHHIRTLAALADFADSGIPVDYLIGNHDFGHRSYFEQELGITIHYGDLDIFLHGQRFYLAHGDGKAFNDHAYLLLRRVLRHSLALWAWRWLHPDIGIGIAAYFSRQSRTNSSIKSYGNERNGLECFAEEKIKRGWNYVLMGHLHQATVKHFEGEQYQGTYINTGTWLDEPMVAVFNGRTTELQSVSAVLSAIS